MARALTTMLATLVALACLVPIEASQSADNADFKKFVEGCASGCAKNPAHREICDQQCTCIATTLRDDRGIKSFRYLKLPKAEIQRLNLICSAEVGIAAMVETCNKDCKSDQACLQTCKCLSTKIRENRTPEEVGKIFNSLAANSAAIDELRKACLKP